MDKSTVIAFNTAYAAEATEAEKQLVNDMLNIWGKLEPTAGRNPSNYRRGVLFGLALQKAIAAGEISLPEVRAKRKEKTATGLQGTGNE